MAVFIATTNDKILFLANIYVSTVLITCRLQSEASLKGELLRERLRVSSILRGVCIYLCVVLYGESKFYCVTFEEG